MKVTKLARHSLTDKRTRQTYYKVRVYRKQNLHTLCEALTSSNKHGSIRIIVESKIVLMNNLFRNRRDLEKKSILFNYSRLPFQVTPYVIFIFDGFIRWLSWAF